MCDGVNDSGRKFFSGERFEDLGFGQVGVVENDGENLRMAFGEERACDSSRAATGERDFLAERKLREPGEELLFGDALEFGGHADGQRELSEIHQVKIFDEAETGQPWRVRMEGECALDAIVFEKVFSSGDFFEDFGGEIFAVEQEAELSFVERGIAENSEQDIVGLMLEESGEVVARGG